jgi:hypothetical protein
VIQALEPTTQNFDNSVNLWQCTATFKFRSGTVTQGAITVMHYGVSDTHRIVDVYDGLIIASNAGNPLITI